MSLALLNAYASDDSDDENPVSNDTQHESNQSPSQPTPTTENKIENISLHKRSIVSPESQSHSHSQHQHHRQQQKPQQQTQNQKRKQKKFRRNPQFDSDLPPELLAELQRTGQDPTSVDFVDIDVRATLATPSNSSNPNNSTKQRQHQQFVPRSQVHKTAERIAKTANVSRLERRRHQITALAAEAAALQVARQTFPGSSSISARRGRRR